jgi:hypothetical protein
VSYGELGTRAVLRIWQGCESFLVCSQAHSMHSESYTGNSPLPSLSKSLVAMVPLEVTLPLYLMQY